MSLLFFLSLLHIHHSLTPTYVHSVVVLKHTQRTLAWGGREVIFDPPKKNVYSFVLKSQNQKYLVTNFQKKIQKRQELRMLSSVTINCQVSKIVMNSGSQLLEL